MAQLDLAVVGGGVAGTFVAYRLSQTRPGWSIALFEATGRIGGRLISIKPPGIDGIKAELGGMRFRTSQPHVSAVVRELALPTRPFRTAHEQNAFLLRGARLTAEDFHDRELVPYEPAPTFRGKTPGELLFQALDAIVPGAANLTASEWATHKKTATYRGRPLYECPLGDLLRDVVGDDGYALITDSFGYVSVFGDRNAADAIPWLLIEARPESENTTLVDGMERLPRELGSRFAARGGAVSLGRRLLAVRRQRNDFKLQFADGETVEARRVVLAMPQSALAAIGGIEIIASRLDTVTARPAGKLCLCYESAWWRESEEVGLRTTADSPLQKVYWFDRAVDQQGGPAVVLSYTDGKAHEFWHGLSDRSSIPADTEPFDSTERWDAYGVLDAMMERAHIEMTRIATRPDVPRPYAVAYMDWAWPPASGAYSLWNVGVRSWEEIPAIVQPLSGAHLYVCGESFSESQGWIEGALETAQMVVDRLST